MGSTFFKRQDYAIKRYVFFAAALLIVGLRCPIASAECLSLVSGPVVVDIAGCKVMEPEKFFDPAKKKYKFVTDLDSVGRKAFLDTYRGLFVKVKVVKSNAVQKGLTNEAGALNGQSVFMFIPPTGDQCNVVAGKRLSGTVVERCCDGSGNVPCLLDTGFILKDAKVIGSTSSAAGDEARQKAARSAFYKTGLVAYKAKKYKAAAASFEKARANGELDMRGHYYLGHAYREIDQCGDAITPLKHIYDASLKKSIWADEEEVARKGSFLLARCYSRTNDPGATVLILNSYLLEPAKFKKELKDSLTDSDFGWIHTSKEYRDYKKEVQKKLK